MYPTEHKFLWTYNVTGFESRFLAAALGDLCSIRQISHLKMIVHDYHNMQHHMAMSCGHTPNHTHTKEPRGSSCQILNQMKEALGRGLTKFFFFF